MSLNFLIQLEQKDLVIVVLIRVPKRRRMHQRKTRMIKEYLDLPLSIWTTDKKGEYEDTVSDIYLPSFSHRADFLISHSFYFKALRIFNIV